MMNKFDRDDTANLQRMRALPFALGFASLAVTAAVLVGHVVWYVALLTGVVAFFIVLLVPEALASSAGAGFARIYSPTGQSTPSQQQYSLADSLLARGKVAEAGEAYRALTTDFPSDPEPRIRMARLLRDETGNYPEAAVWYNQALELEGIAAGTKAAIMRELIEVYTHKAQKPQLALPYLERFIAEFPTHPARLWANREYNEIKAMQPRRADG